jgi:hypothetical protein
VPRNIWSDTNLNFGLFEWINGKEIVEITDNHINSAADFVVSLAKLSKHTSHEKFGQASAACFSGEMIDEQIRDRYAVFFEHSNSNSHLVDFLDKDFSTSYKKILSRSKKNWPGEFETVLANEFQILSPSDFGLHNALLTKNGLIFMDFEYFGWDDPAKLTCDFLLHPGMMLTDGQKTLWLERMKEFFSVEKNFQQRCEASYCLYGLCWCLIILNVFVTGRKSNNAGSADENITKGKKQTNRLNRSRDLLEHINKVNNNGLMYE